MAKKNNFWYRYQEIKSGLQFHFVVSQLFICALSLFTQEAFAESKVLNSGDSATITSTAGLTGFDAVTLNGGTLNINIPGSEQHLPVSAISTVTVNNVTGNTISLNSTNIILDAALVGTGTLVKTGVNHLLLAGNNANFAGTIYSDEGGRFLGIYGTQGSSAKARWNLENGASLFLTLPSATDTGYFEMGDLSSASSNSVVRPRDNNAAVTKLKVGSLGLNSTFKGNLMDQGNSKMSVTKTGSGVWTLEGDNNFSQGLFVEQGKVLISGGGTTGSGSIAISTGAVLELAKTSNLTIPTVISGEGELLHSGSGTTVLTGANTYSGNTTISAGTLQLGSAGTTGALSDASNITLSGGTLAFNRSDVYVLSSASLTSNGGTLMNSGSGVVSIPTSVTGSAVTFKAGSAMIALSGNLSANAVTLASGTLRIGYGFVAGGVTSNTISIAQDAVLEVHTINGTGVWGGKTSGTIASTISGKGTIRHANNSGDTITLNGNNAQFTGTIEIQGGIINVTPAGFGGTTQVNLQGGTLCTQTAANTSNTAKVNVTADSTLWISNNVNWSFGNLTGDKKLSKIGTGHLILRGDNSQFTGSIDIKENWLGLQGSASSNGNIAWKFYAGTGIDAKMFIETTSAGDSGTYQFGDLSGGGATSVLRPRNSSVKDITIEVGKLGLNSSFDAQLLDDSGHKLGVIKVGSGTWTLTNSANAYTGATVIREGTLNVSGSLTGSNVTVEDGAILTGTGSIAGNVMVQDGGRIQFDLSAWLSETPDPLDILGSLAFESEDSIIELICSEEDLDDLHGKQIAFLTSPTLREVIESHLDFTNAGGALTWFLGQTGDTYTLQLRSDVPEPGTCFLLLSGFVGIVALSAIRKQRQQKKKHIGKILTLLAVALTLGTGTESSLMAEENTPTTDVSAGSLLNDFQKNGMPDEILFVTRKPSSDPHWYANIGYYADNSCRVPFPRNSGGTIWIYNVKTKEFRKVFEDAEGNVRDPQIHYDGQKFIFSYLPKGKKHYSLFEMNLDGTGLRQITGLGEDTPIPVPEGVHPLETNEIRRSPKNLDGVQDYPPTGWDDYEPIYTPDDKIIFCSTRAKRYVQCYYTQVGILHKCELDGSDIHCISANVEQDNTPWILNDGRVAHMRWEYVDRHWGTYHSLWTVNPDGTKQMVLYGNFASWDAMLAPKPIPGCNDKIICTFSPGHGRKEHYGRIVLLDTTLGPDNTKAVHYITEKADYSDPWAFNENHFLASARDRVVLLTSDGKEETLFELPKEIQDAGFWIGEPRPVMSRPREVVLPDQTDPAKDFGTLALVNVYHGRMMKDVKPGTIKYLQIYEVLPKPVNFSGGMDMISNEGTFSVTRLLGTVPVSPDGSAYFNLPAKRSVLFCAMDEKNHCVKRMHSFTSVMPGEMTTCIGCHEERTETPSAEERDRINRILRTVPVNPEKIAGVPEIFVFPRDIQPILDRHCLECHNPDHEEGGFNISGEWNPLYTFGYMQMSWRKMFGDNRNRSMGNFLPYQIGTGSSQLLKLIEEHHEGVNMTEEEQKIIRCWLDAGANYSGVYAASGCGGIGYFVAHVNIRNDNDWPETEPSRQAIHRRCDGCHCPTDEEKKIGNYSLNTEYKASYWPPQDNHYVVHDMCEESGRYNRHEIWNLSYPEKSKVLRAPLSKEAGGLGKCEAASGQKVFADTNDPDYQLILKYIERGRRYILEEDNRFSMLHPSPNNGLNCPQHFTPRWGYLREMIRYGILSPETTPKSSIDPYDVEGRYWQSLWYVPVK